MKFIGMKYHENTTNKYYAVIPGNDSYEVIVSDYDYPWEAIDDKVAGTVTGSNGVAGMGMVFGTPVAMNPQMPGGMSGGMGAEMAMGMAIGMSMAMNAGSSQSSEQKKTEQCVGEVLSRALVSEEQIQNFFQRLLDKGVLGWNDFVPFVVPIGSRAGGTESYFAFRMLSADGTLIKNSGQSYPYNYDEVRKLIYDFFEEYE